MSEHFGKPRRPEPNQRPRPRPRPRPYPCRLRLPHRRFRPRRRYPCHLRSRPHRLRRHRLGAFRKSPRLPVDDGHRGRGPANNPGDRIARYSDRALSIAVAQRCGRRHRQALHRGRFGRPQHRQHPDRHRVPVAAVLAAASALRYYLVTTIGERVVAEVTQGGPRDRAGRGRRNRAVEERRRPAARDGPRHATRAARRCAALADGHPSGAGHNPPACD